MSRFASASCHVAGACGLALALALAAGCRFAGPAGAGDAPSDPLDAPAEDAPGVDAPVDGPPAAPMCLERWYAGTVTLTMPTQLTALGSPEIDRDPYVTSDELTIYFSTYRSGTANGDVYAATRASIAMPFGAPAPRADLTSPNADSRVTMSPDELFAIVSTGRTGGEGNTDLWIATRTDEQQPFGGFTQTGLANVNSPDSELDPELGASRLHLYLAIGSPQRIAVSVRSTVTSSFGNAQQINSLFSDTGDFDPSLSPDERIIVFGSNRDNDGDGDLWYATRAGDTGAFGTPVRVPAVNSDSGDGDPSLSADGCRLYFASDRTGHWELFVAAVTP